MFGIEERSIRAQNVALHKKLMQTREQKAMLDKVPEQMILSEVRKVVENMQRLNDSLTKTEKDVEKYFKSMRKDANAVIDGRLEAEEATMRDIVQMQLSNQNMLQEKSEIKKESTTQEMAHSVSANMSEENIAQKKEDKASTDLTNSVSHKVEIALETKAKKQQDPGT
ncbi:hypothetical protein SUGI_0492890 [Cryptomeria japonica]|nr:hypothetical protein SUGI_0492890 [Cryptomeria japonica]